LSIGQRAEILLEDYIKPMGVSVRAVAMALHVPYSRLSEITKGERGESADTVLRLERYFGSEAKGWLNLQAAYELRVAEIENGKTIAKEIQPFALAAWATPAGSTRTPAAGQQLTVANDRIRLG
jgi:addiction module HigA family antidote